MENFKNAKNKKFEVPHTYVIIIGIIILAYIASYIIPAGQYDRIKNPATGRMIIDAATYKNVANTPLPLLSMENANLFTSVIKAMKESAGIIFFTLLVCGSFNMIQKTGAIEAGIVNCASRLRRSEFLLVPLVMLIFSIGGVTIGMNTEVIAFIPLGIIMARALGYDAIVGMSMMALGAAVGFVGGFVNPFTVGVAQAIAGLPMYSALGFRVVVYIILYVVTCWYIMRYGKKVKANPELSVVRDLELTDKIDVDFEKLPKLTGRDKGVLLVFVVGFALIITGVLKYEWGTDQMIGVFLAMGMTGSFVGGIKPNKAAGNFIAGAQDVVFGALSIGLARTILVVLEDGKVLDSILFYMSSGLSQIPSYISVLLMYVVQIITNVFIPSGSGQAATTMPIMAPLAELVGITKQTAVLAFQYGDGFTNYINVTSGGLMSYLAISKISYDTWVKWMWPLMRIWFAIGAAAILVAHAMKLQ